MLNSKIIIKSFAYKFSCKAPAVWHTKNLGNADTKCGAWFPCRHWINFKVSFDLINIDHYSICRGSFTPLLFVWILPFYMPLQIIASYLPKKKKTNSLVPMYQQTTKRKKKNILNSINIRKRNMNWRLDTW